MRFATQDSAIALALLTFVDTASAASRKPSQAVLLADIRSLTLRADKLTTARRVDAIPQLSCLGGSAQGLYEVDVMRCTNAGSSYNANEIEWTCTASLPAEFKLGSTDVICEGYDSPDDPYVLKGSCGVEYRLVLTDAGEAKYGKRRGGSRGSHGQHGGSGSDENTSALITSLFFMIFIAVGGFIVWGMVKAFFERRRNPTGEHFGGRTGGGGYGGGGAGGGGGGGDFDDPPPPYDPSPDEKPRYDTRSMPSSAPGPASSSSQAQAGSRFPSYGTAGAVAAAAAAGYMAGRSGGQRTADQSAASSWFRNSRDSGEGASNLASRQASRAERPPSPPRRAPSSSSFSSTRHESTGFGETRRR